MSVLGLIFYLTRLYYGWIGLRISIIEQRLVKVFYNEFEQNLGNGSLDTRRSPCKLGFDVDKHGWKYGQNSPISNFNIIYESVYGIHGTVHLWVYVNQALLCVSMAENQNLSTNFCRSVVFHIVTVFMKRFMRYMKSFIYGFMRTRRCYGSVWLEIGIARQRFLKVCHVEFEATLSHGIGALIGRKTERHHLHIRH
jgi:hypothetical protein